MVTAISTVPHGLAVPEGSNGGGAGVVAIGQGLGEPQGQQGGPRGDLHRLCHRRPGVISAQLHPVVVTVAVVADLRLQAGLVHRGVQVGGQGDGDLAVFQGGVDLLLLVQDAGDVVEDDLRLLEGVRPVRDGHVDGVVDLESGILVEDDLHRAVHPADDEVRHVGTVVHPDGVGAAAPDHHPAVTVTLSNVTSPSAAPQPMMRSPSTVRSWRMTSSVRTSRLPS